MIFSLLFCILFKRKFDKIAYLNVGVLPIWAQKNFSLYIQYSTTPPSLIVNISINQAS